MNFNLIIIKFNEFVITQLNNSVTFLRFNNYVNVFVKKKKLCKCKIVLLDYFLIFFTVYI